MNFLATFVLARVWRQTRKLRMHPTHCRRLSSWLWKSSVVPISPTRSGRVRAQVSPHFLVGVPGCMVASSFRGHAMELARVLTAAAGEKIG